MEELNLFPEERLAGTQVLLAHFDQKGLEYGLRWLTALRAEGVRAELYPEVSKLKKQLEYASKKELPFVGICGDEEIASGRLMVKNLTTGEQESLTLPEAIVRLKK